MAGKPIGSFYVQLGLNTKTFSKNLLLAQRSLRNFFGTAAIHASEIMAASIAAIGTALAGLSVKAVRLASDLDKQRIALIKMLGSAEAANKKIKELQQFAAKTGFAFSDLVDYQKRLMAVGFTAQETKFMLYQIADATAIIGNDADKLSRIIKAFGDIKAKGVLQTQEMKQLTELGIPAWDMLGKAIGKTREELTKLVESRKISAETALWGITDTMGKMWGGMSDEISKKLSGAFNRLKAVIEIEMTELGDWIKDNLPLTEAFNKLANSIIRVAESIKKNGLMDSLKKFRNEFSGLSRIIENIAIAITAMLLPGLISMGLFAVLAFSPLIVLGAEAVIIVDYLRFRLDALSDEIEHFRKRTDQIKTQIALLKDIVITGFFAELDRLLLNSAHTVHKTLTKIKFHVASFYDYVYSLMERLMKEITKPFVAIYEDSIFSQLKKITSDIDFSQDWKTVLSRITVKAMKAIHDGDLLYPKKTIEYLKEVKDSWDPQKNLNKKQEKQPESFTGRDFLGYGRTIEEVEDNLNKELDRSLKKSEAIGNFNVLSAMWEILKDQIKATDKKMEDSVTDKFYNNYSYLWTWPEELSDLYERITKTIKGTDDNPDNSFSNKNTKVDNSLFPLFPYRDSTEKAVYETTTAITGLGIASGVVAEKLKENLEDFTEKPIKSGQKTAKESTMDKYTKKKFFAPADTGISTDKLHFIGDLFPYKDEAEKAGYEIAASIVIPFGSVSKEIAAKIKEGIDDSKAELTDYTKWIGNIWQNVGTTLNTVFQDALLSSGNFFENVGENLHKLGNQILAQIAQLAIMSMLFNALGIKTAAIPSGLQIFRGGNIVTGSYLGGSIKDGVVSDGKIITTHPDDYIIATKDPSSLGGKANVVVNVNNNSPSEVSTNSYFDGTRTIIDIVIDGLQRNVNGLRDTVRAI